MSVTKVSSEMISSGLGKVLQVLHDTTTDAGTSHSTSTYVDIGLQITITPSATSSKVFLAFCSQGAKNGTMAISVGTKLLRDSTALFTYNYDVQNQGTTNIFAEYSKSHFWLDSPSSTSEIVYKVQQNSQLGAAATIGSQCSIIAMEIAG